MTGQQQTVMWLGIILIVTRLFTTSQWSQIWGVVGNTPAAPAAPGTAGKCASNQLLISGKCYNKSYA